MVRNSPPDNHLRFHNTTIGKIVIGLVIAAGAAVISFAAGRLTVSLTPPSVLVEPQNIVVRSGEFVEFSAAGSTDPKGSALEFEWSLGGVPFDEASIGKCVQRPDPAVIGCHFTHPGKYAVNVTGITSMGLSSGTAASVSVIFERGYFGITLGQAAGDDVYRELLYGIDWTEIQSLIAQPIILFDPDSGGPVFAVSFEGLQEYRAVERPTGALDGRRLVVTGAPPRVQEILELALRSLGASIATIPFGEVFSALERGAVDGGAVPLNDPNDLMQLIREL